MTPKSEDNFAEHFSQLGEIKLYTLNKLMKSLLIIPGASEPSVRTLRFFRNYPLLLLYPMYLNFASSNCLPHLPYIVRFIIFNLLLVPSTNPLL